MGSKIEMGRKRERERRGRGSLTREKNSITAK